MTSVNTGSGDVRVCDSTVAGDAVLAVGPGAGTGAAVAGGSGEGVAIAAGSGEAVVAVADPVDGAVGAGVADAVDVGAGAGLANAGESGTAESEARVTTNAVRSAVVFRIEFTFVFQETAAPLNPQQDGRETGK